MDEVFTGSTPVSDEPRETAATTTALVVGFLRSWGGEAAVDQLLRVADVGFTAAELEDPSRWYSYATRIRLFEAATQVTGDPDVTFAIGATAPENGLAPTVILLLQAVGTPAQIIRQLPAAVTKFSTTSTMEVLELGRTHASLRFRLHEGYTHSRLDCRYAQGLLSNIPTLCGLPPATIDHRACESDGAPACIYEVHWRRRSRLPWRRGYDRDTVDELRALREQLQTLQTDAADLVSSDDLDTTLRRITERAAAAVIAPGYVLAARPAEGTTPLIRSAGLDPVTADRVAQQLLAGERLHEQAVAVEVRTARRSYGHLAAIYGPDQQSMAHEAALLAAYANHVAAALELVLSRDASRRDAARARELVALAGRLSRARDEQAVADAVIEAIRTIVGTSRATVLRWDAGTGQLEALACSGLSEAQSAALFASRLRPDDTPELARMLARHEPTTLHLNGQSPALDQLLAAVGSRAAIAMPLLAGDQLLGVATASTRDEVPAGWPDADTMGRVRGIADQAASAMYNTRLLSQIRHQATHDGLTGLPNRAMFMALLRERIDAACAVDDTCTGVLFCDLDGFKDVNDRHGHATGDELLRQVSARLRAVLRGGDTVARLSGDEFALLVTSIGVDAVAGEVGRRVADGFAEPFKVDGHELRISASIGVAVQRDTDDADRLLQRADAAMYVAKRRGRNQIAFADDGAPVQLSARSSGEELRRALAAGAFELHYQPIVALEPGPNGAGTRIVGHEALARWRHPELGLLAPASFIPLAERHGSVVDLDLWAIATAVRTAAAWRDEAADWHVAVNVAAQTLVDPRLGGAVRQALAEADLEAERLTLEIVESRALTDLPGVTEQLTFLRRLGVRTALDDFGTGFSTLTWLQRLPIDQIKLDRSFVAALDEDPDAGSLIVGVLALARALGHDVIAEGVEHETQLDTLRRVGCGLVQGYWFARPTPDPCARLAVT